ncbi:hypothetical protein D3C75_453130 [compost metagenome]
MPIEENRIFNCIKGLLCLQLRTCCQLHQVTQRVGLNPFIMEKGQGFNLPFGPVAVILKACQLFLLLLNTNIAAMSLILNLLKHLVKPVKLLLHIMTAHVLEQPFLMDSCLPLFLINLKFQSGDGSPITFCKEVTATTFILKPRHLAVYLIQSHFSLCQLLSHLGFSPRNALSILADLLQLTLQL